MKNHANFIFCKKQAKYHAEWTALLLQMVKVLGSNLSLEPASMTEVVWWYP